MEQNPQDWALKAAIREGLQSGASDKTVPDIMKDVETRLRADNRLKVNAESRPLSD